MPILLGLSVMRPDKQQFIQVFWVQCCSKIRHYVGSCAECPFAFILGCWYRENTPSYHRKFRKAISIVLPELQRCLAVDVVIIECHSAECIKLVTVSTCTN